jgi:hypothetical protein
MDSNRDKGLPWRFHQRFMAWNCLPAPCRPPVLWRYQQQTTELAMLQCE